MRLTLSTTKLGGIWVALLREVVPASLRQYIEQHIEQLSAADQALLEAASVAGSTFAVAAVVAGVAQASETIEARYTALARQGQFILASGTETWPDGTVTACYQFMHALYHEVVYARVSAGHRVRLHQQIGVRKEVAYGEQASQIAAELAVHFARGHDAGRAVHYLHHAGENVCGAVPIRKRSSISPGGWRSSQGSPTLRRGRRRSSRCGLSWAMP